jgi:hypothetical protein
MSKTQTLLEINLFNLVSYLTICISKTQDTRKGQQTIGQLKQQQAATRLK